MACSALDLTTGLFINSIDFSTATTATMGGRSITISSANIRISGPTGTTNLAVGANHNAKFQFFGTENHLGILIRDTGPGSQQCTVSLIDFGQTPPAVVNVLQVLAASSAVSSPRINFSQGNGNACIVFGTDGSRILGFSIRRSDNGNVLLLGPQPFVPSGDKAGEVTTTQLKITYNSNGTHVISEPLPVATCQVTPASQAFSNVTVGGCAVTPPTKVFTLTNTGDDCLAISSILAAAGPFSLVTTSVPLPATLAKNQSMTATVGFQPVATGSLSNSLAIIQVPALAVSNALHCTGMGIGAQKQLTFDQTTIDFGNQLITPPTTKVLNVINSGTAPIAVSIAAGSGTFQWAGFNGTLDVRREPAHSDYVCARSRRCVYGDFGGDERCRRHPVQHRTNWFFPSASMGGRVGGH